MTISRADSAKMRSLAKEGKQISKIWADEFPALDYLDVYWEVYGSGGRSAQGIKRMITERLNSLVEANKAERKTIVAEIDGLVWHLYSNHKQNQQKLDKLRKVLGE